MGIEPDLTQWLLLDWAMVLVLAWLLIGLAGVLALLPLASEMWKHPEPRPADQRRSVPAS